MNGAVQIPDTVDRAFVAHVDRMFDMWTHPEQFAKWLAPTGFTMQFARADFRAGGNSF
jgi:uncharacterized protein YndB with AHSA1/START domain